MESKKNDYTTGTNSREVSVILCIYQWWGSNRREIAFFRFSNVIFLTLGSPLWVKFPLLGWTWIGAHNILLQHSVSQESNFTWWQMVPPNFVHFPKWRRYILARYLAWLAIWLTLYTVTPEMDWGSVAERLRRWACNLEGLSSSLALTACWICSRQSRQGHPTRI